MRPARDTELADLAAAFPSMPFDGELYRSNGGRGRYLARVVTVTATHVTLEDAGRGRHGRQWTLPLTYFCGPANGWQLIDR